MTANYIVMAQLRWCKGLENLTIDADKGNMHSLFRGLLTTTTRYRLFPATLRVLRLYPSIANRAPDFVSKHIIDVIYQLMPRIRHEAGVYDMQLLPSLGM